MSEPISLEGKLLFPSEYIGAADLKGKDVGLVIHHVEVQNLRLQGGGTKRKPVVFFEKTDKKLVLNKTNARVIAAQHGNEADGWAGKRIVLYPTTTLCGGGMVPCVRVREGNGAAQEQEQNLNQ